MNRFKTILFTLSALIVIGNVIVAVTDPYGFLIFIQYEIAFLISCIPLFFIPKALENSSYSVVFMLILLFTIVGFGFLKILPIETPSQPAIVCESCGNAVEEADSYCSDCGGLLTTKDDTASVCNGCGETIQPDANFCSNCGEPQTN